MDNRRFSSVQFSRSVVSNSLRPHGPQHTRLPCPSPSPIACLDSCPLSWWCRPTMSSAGPEIPLLSPPFQEAAGSVWVCVLGMSWGEGEEGSAPWVCLGSAVMASLASCGHGSLLVTMPVSRAPGWCFCVMLRGPLTSGGSSHVGPGLAGWPVAFGCGPGLLRSQPTRPPLGAPQSTWGGPDKHVTARGSPGWLRELNSGPLHQAHGAPDLALMQVFTVSGARRALCLRLLPSNTPPAPRTLASDAEQGDAHSTARLGPEEMLHPFSVSFLARTSPISHPPQGIYYHDVFGKVDLWGREIKTKSKKELDKQKKLAN